MFEEEYKDGKISRREYRCRVCDGPVEQPIQLICDECDRRETEQMEREFYAEFVASEDVHVYRKLTEDKEVKA